MNRIHFSKLLCRVFVKGNSTPARLLCPHTMHEMMNQKQKMGFGKIWAPGLKELEDQKITVL